MAGSITNDLTERLTNVADLTAVANAIRSKGGTTDPLVYPGGFVTAINNIQASSGGVDTKVNTVAPDIYNIDVDAPTFYLDTSKVDLGKHFVLVATIIGSSFDYEYILNGSSIDEVLQYNQSGLMVLLSPYMDQYPDTYELDIQIGSSYFVTLPGVYDPTAKRITVPQFFDLISGNYVPYKIEQVPASYIVNWN